MKDLAGLLPLVLIFAVFWFLIIRPQQRRQREMQSLQRALSVGQEVVLTSGIYATVREIADDHVKVEIATGVVVKVARAAVGQVLPEPGPVDLEKPADAPEES